MRRINSQTSMILKYLQEHPAGLTQMDAITMFGCTRLAARIADIRHDGYNVISDTEVSGDKRYSRYRLEVKDEN